VKGLGGFHLACDAENPAAVTELRNRKNRVDKPFALMMADMALVEKNCYVSEAERRLLSSLARPIVLLRRKPGSKIAREAAPGQDHLGVMLPYTPLHYLLFSDERVGMKSPLSVLVMTSGNLAEEPIAIDNQEARQRLSSLADAFIMHDRDIHIRCDDSVVRVFEEQKISLPQTNHPASKQHDPVLYPVRRSRGYSPFPVKLPFKPPALLATGPELKNTFCITNGDYAFISQHIGDMENYETLRSFERGVDHFEKLFRAKPEVLAHDLHPDYLSTRYALKRGRQENLPLVGIQHHHAHIAACMAEHRLEASRVVIGIAFDGTGYGEDGAIWGGEILIAGYKEFKRALQVEYFPLPGGDAAIKKPARTALALLWSLGLEWDENLSPTRFHSKYELENLRIQLERKLNAPMTSSAGRLFDAAASIAGIRQSVNYEAQAAIEFEAMADADEQGSYPFAVDGSKLKIKEAFAALVKDALSGVPTPIMSARFHNGLAESVRAAAMKVRNDTDIRDVVLSGGVWQNITLLGRTLSLLDSEGFSVYIHREVPTNDGGISLGQAVIAAQRLRG
jgi:hydrogenase maturation protein HypF